MAEAISAINGAVTQGDPSTVMEALKAAPAGIRSITEECAETYVEKLAAARQEKIDTGMCWGGRVWSGSVLNWSSLSLSEGVEDSEGWNEHRTKEGVSYYHNSHTGVSQWERPSEFKGQSQELNRDEIQVCIY